MSRPSQQRTMQQQQPKPPKQHLTEQEAIAASELFDLFCVATTMRQVLGLHRDMCDILGLRPAPINEFYPMLKAKIHSWKAQALWKKFDARAAHRVYAKGTACNGTRVLVIGAGPCGMRTAIEAQLLGAKVVVLEKRDRITRNNVLHLWPFVITDLRNLGAKKFYGKFCAGSIDHISIRQLQIILMKVALLLGVEIHENVSFERTIEPSGDGFGWRAAVTPTDHVVSYYEFDVLIGADGKRNTLEGFKRKEFRGKLAIAITANFINKKTEAEAKAEEISGVAFIFNQSFFKELYEKTGIDLENIVYYKDETHYFVMTAKKHSLIDKGVILQDFSDPAELLAPANVSADKLLDYAREAAEFSTKYQMPNLEFAVNHYGKPDVAMFDFTSMFASETSCRVIVRQGFRLLQCLVGDSLLEPFWPTGSGCARGFLSSMDAAYATKLWSNTRNSILTVVAQRESIYRLLGQTTPENLQRDTGSYTVDPASRYPNLNRTAVNPFQVRTLVDSDDPKVFEQPISEIVTTPAETPALLRKPRRSADIVPEALLHWVRTQLNMYDFIKDVQEPADILKNGKSLCALISRFRPDLIDYASTRDLTPAARNEVAFRILESEYQLPRIMSGEKSLDLEKVDARHWLHYLSQVREVFRGEVPHLKHPKMDITELREKYRLNNAHAQPDFSKLLQLSTKPKYTKAKSPIEDMVDVPQVVHRRSVMDEERVKRMRRHEPQTGSPAAGGNTQQQGQTDTPRRAKKRRSAEKAANIEERQKRLQEIEENRMDRLSKRRQQRYQQTQNFYKSLQMLQANTLLRETDDPSAFEDYSLFIYRQHAPEFNDRVKELEQKLLHPDRNRGDIPSAMPRNIDDQFSDRIKSMEQRISSRNAHGTDKKPKDLMRAIGKIDSSDWNVREIEKKIEQSKRTETHGPKGREKVPKWSKEQFLQRQNKMAKPTRQESVEEKFKEIDQTLKNLDKQLKEGSILEVGERGRNKVASIAGQFAKKEDNKPSDEKNPTPPTSGNSVPKSSAKVALAFKKQAASEKCHFCKQIVYLMEKITAEDLIFHRSCLKCHHCHTNLRLGGYAFDRDDPNGRFYCTQHFRLPAKAIRPVVRKPGQRKPTQQQQQAAAAAAAVSDITATRVAAMDTTSPDMLKTPDKLRGPADSVVQLDLLDRGQTPERIEFENTDAMSDGEPSEEHILDEHEWSGRNFLPESNQDSESDLSSSDDSDTESDADMFEEANDSPLGAQTLQLATDWIGKQHYSDSDDSDDFYDTSEEIADDNGKDDDDTEGEDFKKARERRREEVRLLPLPANLPTDTETEIKPTNENNENGDVEMVAAAEIAGEKTPTNQSLMPLPADTIQKSKQNGNAEKPLETAESKIGELMPLTAKVAYLATPPPTKADIEKLEQTTGRRFSAEIEAINEKLHRLNSVVKMNRDIETIAKENLVKSDILKKLTMKEKWLADNALGNTQPTTPPTLAPKSTFENRFALKQDILKEQQNNAVNEIKKAETVLENLKAELNAKNKKDEAHKAETTQTATKPTTPEEVLESLKAEIKSANLNRAGSLKRQQAEQQKTSPTTSPSASKKPSATASRSNSFKNKPATASNGEPPNKSGEVSRTNSLKRSERFTSKDEVIANDGRMQIQNILGLVKNFEQQNKPTDLQKKHDALAANKSNSDIGKLLYDAESKFSPKTDKRAMQEKLKEIEAKSFSGTMDAIKSQMVVPTVSAQANLSVDLSKYFPDQKQQKSNGGAVNKNQKNLKDVDLAKYFPSSPTAQRRSTVVTVADKLKKSQTEQAIAHTAEQAPKNTVKNTGNKETSTKPANNAQAAPKRQASLGGNNKFSLRDHQLDGAVDLSKKKAPVLSATTTAATATVTKKGNVKIIKKIVPKKKAGNAGATKKLTSAQATKSIVPRDDADRVLDEILQTTDKEMHSPSAEYLQLFKEEKSPSEDLSDKVERIFQETGIDLGLPQRPSSDNKKRLLKTKSLGEGEFEGHPTKEKLREFEANEERTTKEEGDRPTGVQGLLARYESLSSVKSSEQSFKLRRMESNTSNLNKSRESLISHDSILSRESDTMSDLEKTMEYLKSEWRSEATNFLQKKRDKFYAQKRALADEEEEASESAKAEAMKKTKYEDLPAQFRESKIAKFFGIQTKTPEKAKTTTTNKQASEKKNLSTTTTKKAAIKSGAVKKSPTPVRNVAKKAGEIKAKTKLKVGTKDANRNSHSRSPTPVKNELNTQNNTAIASTTKRVETPKKSASPPKSLMENFEIDLLVEKGSLAASSKLQKEHVQNNVELHAASETSTLTNEPSTRDVETANEQAIALTRKNSNSAELQQTADDSDLLRFRRPLVEELCKTSAPNTEEDTETANEEAMPTPAIILSRKNSNSSVLQQTTGDSDLMKQRPLVEDAYKTSASNTEEVAETANEKVIPAHAITLSRQNSNSSDLQQTVGDSPLMRRRPLVEDIRNLPKTGCDKSLSNSRRNSQTSLNASRRCSDASLQDKVDGGGGVNAVESKCSTTVDAHKLFQNVVERFAGQQHDAEHISAGEDEVDSLCTSISKSPSVAPTTVRPRGSSEDESIEKLFSQFSDDMLVNVEFDSNDELIAITPRLPLEGGKTGADIDDDFIDRLESLEKDELCIGSSNEAPSKDTSANMLEKNEDQNSTAAEAQTLNADSEAVHKSDLPPSAAPLTLERIQSLLYMEAPETPFPIRPQRRQKSTSSSSEASNTPIAPQRMKHKLAKLCPDNMPPSVQDLMQTVFTKSLTAELAAKDAAAKLQKFPRNISEDELDDMNINKSVGREVKNDNACIDEIANAYNADSVLASTQASTSENVRQTNDTETLAAQETITAANNLSSDPKVDTSATAANAICSPNRKLSQASTDNIAASSSNNRISPSEYRAARRKSSLTAAKEETIKPQEATKANEIPHNQETLRLPQGRLTPTTNVNISESPLMQWRLQQQQALVGNDAANKPDPSQADIDTQSASKTPLNKSSKESLNETSNPIQTPSKAQSKERSLEWDMTKMPASPMPRRKFVHAERQGVEDIKIKDVSPTSSIKMLNNLSSNSSDTDERRIIEDIEMERRQALIQRDKNYQELEQKEKEKINTELEQKEKEKMRALKEQQKRGSNYNSSNSSLRSTPLTTPLSSRRGTQDSISTAQRESTPPNFKKLVIPTESGVEDLSTLSSRCSSYAFIELMSNGEPRIAPMPQKLKIPAKPLPNPVIDPNEPIAEVFLNRSWPKPDMSPEMQTSESPDTVIEMKRSNSEPKSPTPEIFRNRKWPDGKTVYDKAEQRHTDNEDDVDEFLRKLTKNSRKFIKLQSHSPQPTAARHKLSPSVFSDDKSTSKSITDLNKLNSIYNSEASLNRAATRSSRSSGESSATNAPQRPMRRQRPVTHGQTSAAAMDASTRMLLDRSKNLHKRKSEFLNERAAERNPYLRDAAETERLEYDGHESSGDELDCYRPSGYTSAAKQLTRFPTTRTLGRERSALTASSSHYIPTYGSDYALSSRRLYPTSTTSTSALDYSPYLGGGSGKYGNSIGRSMHFNTHNDYMRRSPSRQREREHSKDSCVQSDSESSSAKEVELNSATEISTDSEFDHDEIARETPKIFIDDTHLKKPTKVQVKSTIIASTAGQRHHVTTTNNTHNVKGSYLQKYQVNPPQPQFKPLVQVDPTLLTKNRAPLQNPRPGDYLLNKTASTEGIASKKSLELKKRYLLGEQGNGNKIQKSGSTSVLDSRIRSFQSNISECQKLLNPGNGISPSMKTFLDRTKNNDLLRSATTNILNDLKIEITVQKASSTASTDNEKENVYVNSKNELNKGMEYSETVNTALVETVTNKKSPTTPTNNHHTIIETIDLVTPEKAKSTSIIDLTKEDVCMSNKDLSKNETTAHNNDTLLTADSNKIVDISCESPVKSDKTIIEEVKPDVSKDVKECIPDILGHIGQEVVKTERNATTLQEHTEDQPLLSSHSYDDEKMDSPEKLEEQFENETLQIQVPNIPWSTQRKGGNMSSTTTGSSCTSNSSSIEDIQHYILESTTSPDTQTGGVNAIGGGHQVPRVEIHDTSGTLMQIDSLMIIDGKYIGDPEDLKYMEIPEGVVVPQTTAAPSIVKTTETEYDDNEADDIEPVTATPEPIECTIIAAEQFKSEQVETKELKSVAEIPPLPERGPPLPEHGPPTLKKVGGAYNLKFDTKNENKVESLKNLPLIVDEQQTMAQTKAVKPITLNLSSTQKSPNTPTTPTAATANRRTPTSPYVDSDVTPTGELISRGSDSETELTGTGQAMTETELSDWTADDCISENFVDMEFVLNSNRGTIKRSNKKERKRMSAAAKLPTTIEMLGEITKTAPVAEFEGILKSIDIDDIEFMDTGSEGSCAEPYAATNTALLRNRGYMEFIDATPKQPTTYATVSTNAGDGDYKPIPAKRGVEKLGVDYIEQGAYILQQSAEQQHEHDVLKTPVNEEPQMSASSLIEKSQVTTTGPPSLMTQSLTDSSTLNDLADDSLFTATPNSQMQQSATTTTTKTTTEESEALTVVTSPLDTSSGKAANNYGNVEKSTPSSSDKNPKTSQSTSSTTGSTATSTHRSTPPRCLSQESNTAQGCTTHAAAVTTTPPKAAPRKPSNELSYEECVRALQQKITQISSARDSDIRKQRRKSSKGEMPTTDNVQTVIETTPSILQLTETEITTTKTPTNVTSINASSSIPNAASAAQIHKVPEIPTLTSKLEEITKERTKQKDLIHDLVMDKLQSKKQLNAEKRLHRSRQRTLLTSGGGGGGGGYASGGGSSLSPTPKLAAATTTSDTNCTNRAHYHESTAAVTPAPSISTPAASTKATTEQRSAHTNLRENISLQKSSTYVSAYGGAVTSDAAPLKRSIAYQQRPFSEHIDAEQLDAFERYKLTKTPSFSYELPSTQLKAKDEHLYKNFATPIASARHNRTQKPLISGAQNMLESSTLFTATSTENLRTEARARARLKSNTDLGLSPEDKMQIIRQRLHMEHTDIKQNPASSSTQHTEVPIKPAAKVTEEINARVRRLSASKSVNDLVYIAGKQTEMAAAIQANTKSTGVTTDFTSDPNLLLSSSTSIQSNVDAKVIKTKSSRRQKDPERRKSLIQSLSSFFHKEKKDISVGNSGIGSTSALDSAQSERPGTSGAGATTGSGGGIDMGVFSRFRISPKTKEKSKDKDGYMFEGQLHNKINLSNTNIPLNTTPTKKCNKKSSTTALSSSSPQLFIHRPNYMTNHDIDESTPPPIPPLPLNYQRSDDESNATETREQKRQRAISKAVRQAELKRLRIAQEIQREQEEIEVQLRELEARGVLIEKALRGEEEHHASTLETTNIGSNDEKLLKELLEIWRNIKQLKKRDEELTIRQQELQLEHRHAQLKEELNLRLSCNKLDKSSADVAAEGAILNEMLEIVAKRAALRPTLNNDESNI